MVKTDRRVVRTNQALRTAFRQLALTHQYREITVKQLTAIANVNRKTFYLHFDSIDDLAATFSHESAKEILNLINQHDLKTSLAQSGLIFDQLATFYNQSRDFNRLVLVNDDYSFIARKVQIEVARGLTANLQVAYQLSKTDAFICANFLIHNMMTFFRLFFTGQLDLTPEQFKQRLVSLNSTGIHQFFYPSEP
ncbi:TetR/AcrR family transcriptional regulator [Lactiplantibacillus daoliensis]|uniref:TetR/AcrR family transcriptional regulator n=1 Tax=Lactiplantibacillus daoliensis TaxID=2559916 RepID=A0ABW1UF29_9LACO|nr:TetR/AcrR family transcriptional regulator [Lactiplantibacillus daoliensis]